MSNKKPTTKEIDEEIATLKEMKPRVLQHSSFGDDHHAAIDAQINVMEDLLDNDAIYDKYGEDSDDHAENVLNAAVEALSWMEGNGEEGSPSSNWKDLVR